MVDFQEVGFEVFIKNDVETEKFKTHRAFSVSWLTRSVIVQ